jgi:hypothetical protein
MPGQLGIAIDGSLGRSWVAALMTAEVNGVEHTAEVLAASEGACIGP